MNAIGTTEGTAIFVPLCTFFRRPTFLPYMKTHPSEISATEEAYCTVAVAFLKALSDLALPRQCSDLLRDEERLRFYEQNIRLAIDSRPGANSTGRSRE